MKEYNGHRSWNAWNVALWLENDESLYRFAMDCLNKRSISSATRRFMVPMGGERTPDGAIYNYLSVRLALEGLADSWEVSHIHYQKKEDKS